MSRPHLQVATSHLPHHAYQVHPTTWPQDSEMTLTDVVAPGRSGQLSLTHTYLPVLMPPHTGMQDPLSPSIIYAKLDQLVYPCLVISQFMLSLQTHHFTAAPPVLKSASCAKEQRTCKYELIPVQPTPRWSPANTEKQS